MVIKVGLCSIKQLDPEFVMMWSGLFRYGFKFTLIITQKKNTPCYFALSYQMINDIAVLHCQCYMEAFMLTLVELWPSVRHTTTTA